MVVCEVEIESNTRKMLLVPAMHDARMHDDARYPRATLKESAMFRGVLSIKELVLSLDSRGQVVTVKISTMTNFQ